MFILKENINDFERQIQCHNLKSFLVPESHERRYRSRRLLYLYLMLTASKCAQVQGTFRLLCTSFHKVSAFVLGYSKNLSNSPANVICDSSTSMGTWTVQMVSVLFCFDFLFRHFFFILCSFWLLAAPHRTDRWLMTGAKGLQRQSGKAARTMSRRTKSCDKKS